MGRPRKPTAELELTGAFKKNPQRSRPNEPKPSGPLGNPPARLSAGEKKAWFELAEIIPPNVLANSDRWAVEIACRIMARIWEDGIGGKHGVSVGELAQLNQLVGRMGMTPADRSKVGVTKGGEDENEFAQFKTAGAIDKSIPAGRKPS